MNKEYHATYYQANKERMDAATKAWRERNRERWNAIRAKWRKDNPEYHCFIQAKRRASKLNATPKWANMEKIKEIYLNCPKGFHVDHIIPLQGKDICGLHIETNLQYLPASENCKKKNRY